MIRGAEAAVVRRALRERDPLPGTRGFAGRLPADESHPLLVGSPDVDTGQSPAGTPDTGLLVRDVLGRVPLFSETGDPDRWSFDPTDLDDPDPVPAGAVRTGEGDERIWTLPEPAPVEDDRRAVADLRAAIEAALADAPDAAVAFSGGVDSGLVAAGVDGPLYVAGFPGGRDLAAARDAARAFDRELRVVELSHRVLEAAIPAVSRATGRTDAMDLAIALPLYLVAERAAADGYRRLAVGQGADELFGGYAKVADAPGDPRVEADTVRGARREVMGTLPRQLERDVLTLRAAGVEPVAPLLDDRVVAAALGLPGRLLVDGRGERKVALRRAARRTVPARVAFREKTAIQYGSLVARELDRLARRAGFKRRMDDHVRRYVESLQ